MATIALSDGIRSGVFISTILRQMQDSILGNNSRTPEMQKILQELIENAPLLKEQLETFDDEQLLELYREISPSVQSTKSSNSQNYLSQQNQKQSCRQTMQKALPEIVDDLKKLSDEDLAAIYKGKMGRTVSANRSVQKKSKFKDSISRKEQYGLDEPQKTKAEQFSQIFSSDPLYGHRRTQGSVYSSQKNSVSSDSKSGNCGSKSEFQVNSIGETTMIIVHRYDPNFKKPAEPVCNCKCCQSHRIYRESADYYTEFLNGLFLKYRK